MGYMYAYSYFFKQILINVYTHITKQQQISK